MGCSKSSSKREVYGYTSLPQETRKISNNPTLHLKELEKEEQTKPKVSRRKEIIKIRAEINEIETKKPIAKINKTKTWFFEKINKIDKPGTSLVVQRLRIRLPMQGTRVQALVWEDLTCHRATKPVRHNY